MSVWSELMGRVPTSSFEAPPPEGLVMASIDYATGLAADAACGDAVQVPVPEGTLIPPLAGCPPAGPGVVEGAVEWLRDLVR
jgi:hypothetical protein